MVTDSDQGCSLYFFEQCTEHQFDNLPAGQDANHVVGLVAFDADGAVVKVGLRLLVALPDGANLKFTDGLFRRVSKSTLKKKNKIKRRRSRDKLKQKPRSFLEKKKQTFYYNLMFYSTKTTWRKCRTLFS